MSFDSLVCLINGLTSLILGVFVFIRDPRSKLNRQFSFFCANVSYWAFSYFIKFFVTGYDESLFFIKNLLNGAILIPATFFHFVCILLNEDKKYRMAIRIGYLLSIMFLLLNCTPYFASHIEQKFNFGYWPKPGPFFPVFLVYFFGMAFFAHLLMYRNLKTAPRDKQNQIKYVFAGTLIGFLGGATNYFLYFDIPIPPFGNILVPIYVGTVAYAILRYQLLNINIVMEKTFIYSILASIITVSFFIIVYFLEKISRVMIGYHSAIIAVTAIAFFTVIFIPLKNRIQRIIDKYFFHGTIDEIDEENIKLRDELQKSEKLKAVATLAAGMAHEIKNPLTSIKTFTEYLDKKKDDPEFIGKFKKIVGSEVDRINYIVKELLEFSKPSELKLKETDINLLLDETLSFLNNSFLKNNIRVEKHYYPLPPVKIDPMQMKQVFLNILLNAIEAMENKPGTITVSTQQTNGNISISFKDTGKGIAKDDLKRIFDPFFTRKETGTGLGLSVVYGIIQKHGGKIKVESTVGQGTEFEITLK